MSPSRALSSDRAQSSSLNYEAGRQDSKICKTCGNLDFSSWKRNPSFSSKREWWTSPKDLLRSSSTCIICSIICCTHRRISLEWERRILSNETPSWPVEDRNPIPMAESDDDIWLLEIVQGKSLRNDNISLNGLQFQIFTITGKSYSVHASVLFTEMIVEKLRSDPRLSFIRKTDRLVPPNPLSAPVLARVNSWLSNCVKCHRHSRRATSHRMPDRLLDVGPNLSRTTAQYQDLILVRPSNELTEPYAALSHCWGGEVPLKTLTTNIKHHRKGISFNTLPRNFKDAVIVTRWLGLRYIWIDSLCIIQDDPRDWLEQSAKMADVYANAYVTIAATGSPTCEHGFLNTRRCDLELSVPGVLDSDSKLFVREIPLYLHQAFGWGFVSTLDHVFKEYPLLQRGWVLQERALSQRLLHFTKREIVFECEECFECESEGKFDLYKGSGKSHWSTNHRSALSKWLRLRPSGHINTFYPADHAKWSAWQAGQGSDLHLSKPNISFRCPSGTLGGRSILCW
jgi:hypothetical protein